MDALTAWILIAAARRVSSRGSFILRAGRGAGRSALRFVPPAVFTALLVLELVPPAARCASARQPKLLAALAAAPVAWRSHSTTATILVGMAALLAAERYLG
jgi:branched-subunit amino acid transport protein